MISHITIRKPKNEELESIIILINKVFNTTLPKFEEDDIKKCISSEKILVTSINEKVIGYSESTTDELTMNIDLLAIEKEYQNQGLGSLMLYQQLGKALQNNIKKVTILYYSEQNHAFYQKIGFGKENNKILSAPTQKVYSMLENYIQNKQRQSTV